MDGSTSGATLRCPACGGDSFEQRRILWSQLIEQWGLSDDDAAIIERQQGLCCVACGCNLRSMAIAHALLEATGLVGPLTRSVRTRRFRRLRILEINEAGMLTQFLTGLRGHVLVRYPEVQMERLPFETGSFDVVLHSDTLEHVQNPMDGLAESGRVLRPGGSLIFTVPLVSSRLSKRRSDEEPPSFHGTPGNDEFRVVTEYGADIWADVLEAGFGECALVSFDRRGGVSIVARWPTR